MIQKSEESPIFYILFGCSFLPHTTLSILPIMASTLQFALLALIQLLAVQAQSPAGLTLVEWRTGNHRVDSLVEQLTPEEKVALVGGQDDPGNQQQAGYVAPIQRLGIPALRLTDGEA
jgi:hypothetical protein